MSERRAFQCPNCGDAIATLIDRTAYRCDWKVTDWHTRQTGKDGKGKPAYEHTPITKPGCGGVLDNCVHGQKTCDSCRAIPPDRPYPLNWTPVTGPCVEQPDLGIVVQEENRRRRERETEEADRKRSVKAWERGGDTPKPIGAVVRAQLPFMGEPEPTRYIKPKPRQRRSKKT